MEDKLLNPDDFIREGEALIRKGQMLIAYGESLKGLGETAGATAQLTKKELLQKEKEERDRKALERIFNHQKRYLAKQAQRARIEELKRQILQDHNEKFEKQREEKRGYK